MDEHESSKLMKLTAVKAFPNEHDCTVVNPDGIALEVFEGKIIRYLSQGLGINFEIVMPEDNTFGTRKADGNWTGMMGMLVRGEADISTTGLFITSERREAVNFTFPIYVDEYTFMTNKPKPQLKNFAIIQAFSFEVWISIVISIIFTSVFLYIILKRKQTYSLILLETIGSLLEKSFSFEIPQRNAIFLLFTWYLSITILINSYKSVVLSIITVPSMIGIRDISDLAEASKDSLFRCFRYEGSASGVDWFKSNEDRLNSIGECLKRSEIENLYGIQAFFKYPNKKAYFLNRLYLNEYAEDLFVSDDFLSVTPLGIGYAKSFCCPIKLEDVVHRITEAGLYEKYFRDKNIRNHIKKIALENSTSDKTLVSPLSFKDLSSCFLVLFIGYLLSFFALIIEIMHGKFNKYLLKTNANTVLPISVRKNL